MIHQDNYESEPISESESSLEELPYPPLDEHYQTNSFVSSMPLDEKLQQLISEHMN